MSSTSSHSSRPISTRSSSEPGRASSCPSSSYNQHGIRGGQWNVARLGHTRDLFQKEEKLALQGPGISYNCQSPEQNPRKKNTKLYAPFTGGSISHERNLYKREEQRAADVPGPGAHNISPGTLHKSTSRVRLATPNLCDDG